MKLRMPGKDYTEPGFYFITLVTLGRRALFGRVLSESEFLQSTPLSPSPCSGADALRRVQGLMLCVSHPPRQPSSPHSSPYRGALVAYSPFGLIVAKLIEDIPSHAPYTGKLEIKGKAIMPDHIHLLLRIIEPLPHPLGTVINGFNIGVRRAWKALMADMQCQPPDTVPQRVFPLPQADGALRIFERGFNDEVVSRAGQLNAYYEYMRLNPWRLLLKRQHPELFTKIWGKEYLPGIHFASIGNMFLLQRPKRLAVRISRFATDAEGRYLLPRRLKTEDEIQQAIAPFLEQARHGTVLVTPCISPSEKAVVDAAYRENLPVIMLCPQGFSQGYHPSRAHYDACSRGLLLQLAPWPYDPQRKLTKPLCETLNDMARRFADLAPGFGG